MTALVSSRFLYRLFFWLAVSGLLSCGEQTLSDVADSLAAIIPSQSVTTQPWPTDSDITSVDDPAAGLGANSSGMTYQPADGADSDSSGYLWVVKNGPAVLQQMRWDETARLWRQLQRWSITTAAGARPDSEAVAKAEWDSPIVYIAAEKENRSKGKLIIIAYDTQASQSWREWDLTHDRDNAESVDVNVGANNGWEGLTWIPDTDLVMAGFRDERLNKAYSPQDYSGHGSGLFFAGLEKNGKIYAYALNHEEAGFYRIAIIDSGFPAVMGLEYDRSSGYLWAHCDNTCNNTSSVLQIAPPGDALTEGRFLPVAKLKKPDSLPNSNFEGIAIFPDSECDNSMKKFLWIDDSSMAGASISGGTIPCGKFLQRP